jgi:hypothetical protein
MMVKLIPRYKNSQSPTLAAPQPIRVHGERRCAFPPENADKLEPSQLSIKQQPASSVALVDPPPIEVFSAVHNPNSSRLDRYEHVFAQSLIRKGKHNYDVPVELVPEHLMSMSAKVFEEYSGIRMSDEKPEPGFWASVKRGIKRQTWRFRSKDKVLVRALDAVSYFEKVTFTLGLAIHAAQHFSTSDAVDFMMLLSEKLSAKSATYTCGYATYSRLSKETLTASGDADGLPGDFDDKERKTGIYAITSVRGRLAALCFAQAEEMQHTFAVATDELEFAEACRDMGKRNCQILRNKPWYIFDAKYYQSI